MKLDNYPIEKLGRESFPELLKEIPDAPTHLHVRGDKTLGADNRILCVVGSRKNTRYGKEVVSDLISGLQNYPVSIVSGLALGIDAIAHRAALENGIHTIAVPGSGLNENVLYPRTNLGLAKQIVESDGSLVSEFEPDFKAAPWAFPRRNRIMAGLSHATLVVEANGQSGTLITARLALEYDRDVLAVPGSLFSVNSKGPHHLIQTGAQLVHSSSDILNALDIEIEDTRVSPIDSLTTVEMSVYEALTEPKTKDELDQEVPVEANTLNVALSSLELKGVVTTSMGKIRRK